MLLTVYRQIVVDCLQAQIVIDWLENNSYDQFRITAYDSVEYFGGGHIAWENTLKTLKVSLEVNPFVVCCYTQLVVPCGVLTLKLLCQNASY